MCVCECLDHVLTDDQVTRKRTSLQKVLEKRGGEKGRREVLGYLKKTSGAFFFYLVPRDRFVLDGARSAVFTLDFGLNSAVLAVSIRSVS